MHSEKGLKLDISCIPPSKPDKSDKSICLQYSHQTAVKNCPDSTRRLQASTNSTQCFSEMLIAKHSCDTIWPMFSVILRTTTNHAFLSFLCSPAKVYPRPSGAVWTCSLLTDWRLLPRHRRSPKKTTLGWHSYASCQSDAHQLRRQSLQCSCKPRVCNYLPAGPRTAWLVIQPSQTVAEDVFIWTKAQCESSI